MNPGGVYHWENYAFPDGGGIKNRYFICIGSSGEIHPPPARYFITTTSQIDRYIGAGDRADHLFFPIELSKYPNLLPSDSVCDVTRFDVQKMELARLRGPSIRELGRMPLHALVEIYKLALRSKKVSRLDLIQIKDSLEFLGATGLQLPPKLQP